MTGGDGGPVPVDDRAEAAAEAAAGRRRLAVERWNARRPRRFPAGAHPLRPEVAEWAGQVAAGAEARPLWLCGALGNGKTQHVWDAGERLYQLGWQGTIEIVTGPDLFEVIAPPTDWAAVHRLAGCGLLVLDDADAAEPTAWYRQGLYQIANERWADMRPVILTTNGGSLEQLGDRVRSRWSRPVPVLFDGPDYRRCPA
jgi:DNA replication protein DnaC